MKTEELVPAQIPAKRDAESSTGADQSEAPDVKRIHVEKPSIVDSTYENKQSDVPETHIEIKQEATESPARENNSSIQIRVMNLDKFMDQKGFGKIVENNNVNCSKFKKIPKKDFAFMHFEVFDYIIYLAIDS
jgi:hypothetical protein